MTTPNPSPCPHSWTKPQTLLVNGKGDIGSSDGEGGEVSDQTCLDCGAHQGVYHPSFWLPAINYELAPGETLYSKGLVRISLRTVEALPGRTLRITFSDGTSGEANLESKISLNDHDFANFARVFSGVWWPKANTSVTIPALYRLVHGKNLPSPLRLARNSAPSGTRKETMARLQSIAVAGYYPTPLSLIPLIASYLNVREGKHVFFDPCAGDGEAVFSLANQLAPTGEDGKRLSIKDTPWHVFAIEMEQGRFDALRRRSAIEQGSGYPEPLLHGDAFCAEIKIDREHHPGSTVLYLNPPYDLDPLHGRLEERFLRRFTPTLASGGVLVFVVPYYALKASASTLASCYRNIQCRRFPGDLFGVYKQVVLFATRQGIYDADPDVLAQIQEWATDPASIPELELQPEPSIDVQPHGTTTWRAFSPYVMKKTDLSALARSFKPWHTSNRGAQPVRVEGVVPTVKQVKDLLDRKYPLAMPPKAAHIATGVAAGIFNGSVIRADDASLGLPDILIKGCFDKEWEKVEEKTNKRGEVTAEIQIQRPRLVVTVLDLRTKKYHTLGSSVEPTMTLNMAEMTTADVLARYGGDLMRVLLQQCPVAYDPADPAQHFPLPDLARPLYRAQEHVMRAVVVQLGGENVPLAKRRHKTAFILGEIGSGKCLGLGTLVLRYDGTRVPVEDIQTGDLLMGPDSTPRTVLGTTRGRGPLYKVHPVKGDTWVCNDAHILTLVHTVSDDVFDIPIAEYASSKRLKRPLSWGKRTSHAASEFKQFFPENGVDFPSIDPPVVDPYLLGLWYGDGTKHQGEHGLSGVSVTTADNEVVTYLSEVAVLNGLTLTKTEKSCPTYRLSRGYAQKVVNTILTAFRLEVGDGQHVPRSCLVGDRSVRLAFLAGFLDSDGHLSRGVFDFIQKNKAYAEAVCFIARSLGFRATLTPEHKSAHRGQKGEVYWRVCLSGALDQIPTRLPRKKAHPRAETRSNRFGDWLAGERRTAHVNRTGITCEEIGEGEYAGFELDGDGRFLLGDFTVTHNTSIALAALRKMEAKSTLVMCPPHLLDTWKEQIKTVIPDTSVSVLSSVDDVLAYVSGPKDRQKIAILSRETAKLSHSFEGINGRCPACHRPVSESPETLATKRMRCGVQARIPVDTLAHLSREWARSTYLADPTLSPYLTVAMRRRLTRPIKPGEGPAQFAAFRASDLLLNVTGAVLVGSMKLGYSEKKKAFLSLLLGLGLLLDTQAKMVLLIRAIWGLGLIEDDYELRYTALRLAMVLTGESRLEVEAYVIAHPYKPRYSYGSDSARMELAALQKGWSNVDAGLRPDTGLADGTHILSPWTQTPEGWSLNGYTPGTLATAKTVFLCLRQAGEWTLGPACPEPLYQAIPEPRRTPLADFIAKRHAASFDTLVLDEVQEYASEGSAQERAAHLLTEVGWPTLMLTGTISNGYASSMFMNTWATSPAFRQEFDRTEMAAFMDRYGYRKRMVQDKDTETKEVVAFGSQSDRIERSARLTGYAPGVLPLFVYRHLLPTACVLHKSDARVDIPDLTEERVLIEPSAEQKKEYLFLQKRLIEAIRRDQFDEDLAGKLFGAMSELPSYLDRCTSDVGNQPGGGAYEIRYPKELGASLVASATALDPDILLPKEEWLVRQLKEDLASGERTMVFGWHTNLFPRLKRIIERHVGLDVPILEPSKVPTAKRQAWIEKEIVKKGKDVLLCNPQTIQTGLNNLVHFSRIIVFENPACNPIIYRQAIGRIDRIGQTRRTRVYFPLYRETIQEAAHKLLLLKVAVSRATDGLDAEGALHAAGVGDTEALSTMSVGRALAGWITQREANLQV